MRRRSDLGGWIAYIFFFFFGFVDGDSGLAYDVAVSPVLHEFDTFFLDRLFVLSVVCCWRSDASLAWI